VARNGNHGSYRTCTPNTRRGDARGPTYGGNRGEGGGGGAAKEQGQGGSAGVKVGGSAYNAQKVATVGF
jgi:hypothetical protein